MEKRREMRTAGKLLINREDIERGRGGDVGRGTDIGREDR